MNVTKTGFIPKEDLGVIRVDVSTKPGLRLVPWDQRPGKENSVDAISQEIKDYAMEMNDAIIQVTTPGMIPGYGSTNGFDLYIQDRKGGDINYLYKVTQDFMAALLERPEIGSVHCYLK